MKQILVRCVACSSLLFTVSIVAAEDSVSYFKNLSLSKLAERLDTAPRARTYLGPVGPEALADEEAEFALPCWIPNSRSQDGNALRFLTTICTFPRE